MSTYETAQDQYVTVNSIKYAYRLFGHPSTPTTPPLILNIHFRGNMDWWDPALLNALASKRQLLLFDNTGIGRSGGEVPNTFRQWARDAISIVKALGIKQIDVLGFSMGGFAAQMIALEAPALVRRLIVAGSGPSLGPGTTHGKEEYFLEIANGMTEKEIKDGMLHTFFAWDEKHQEKGLEWWDRMTTARKNREPLAGKEAMGKQIEAFMRWFGEEHREEASWDRFAELKRENMRVLVANGSDDLLAPTENSVVMWRKLRDEGVDVQLHVYAQSSHGFLDEYHIEFGRLVNEFLDTE